jgi:cytochrome c553
MKRMHTTLSGSSVALALWLLLAPPASSAVTPAPRAAVSSARAELAAAQRAVPNPAHGAELFRQCVACHGRDGGGQVEGAVPRIAGQHYRVLLKQLVDFRHGLRWDYRMEELADRHHLEGPQDLADVAAHVAALDRAGPHGVGAGEFVEEGERLYAARCQHCHGKEAEGRDADAIPRLAGQHYGYLIRQIEDTLDQRRPTLAPAHLPLIEDLEFEQVRGLMDFLSRGATLE